ncbi:MAG: pectinacetylesterase family protein [Anaerolineae bacterium]|nr:pectinacetylesterase family protein [Anaerolineae bacterium]
MKKAVFGLCAGVVALLALLTGSVMGQEPLPALGDLPAGAWSAILPGGDTICSNGTPYQFFVRPAAEASSSLLVHFQGGGACWFGQICDLTRNPSYDPFVDESDNPAAAPFGIFDFDNAENPFSNYNMVMVPYCTGDVHIGNKITTYTSPAEGDTPESTVTIRHNGYNNAMTVLDWTFDNFQQPDTVFVTGCSAGAIPSPFYTPFVAAAYPEARIEQLGDAAGGYRNPGLSVDTMGNWGTMGILPPEYADFSLREMNFEQFYITAATYHPDISFSQYNTAGDGVQLGFLALTGITGKPLIDLLRPNLADIGGAASNFDAFTAGGDTHCITPTPDFYSYAVDGLRLVDWVAALAAGDEIDSVTCTDCTVAETGE